MIDGNVSDYWTLFGDEIKGVPPNMSLRITYSQERFIGGSPFHHSFKELATTGVNSFRLYGEIDDKGGWRQTHSPCMHHRMTCYVQVSADPAYPSYNCRVRLRREVREEAIRQVAASNGLQWRILNNRGQPLGEDTVLIASVGPAGLDRKIAVDFDYVMEIPHNQRVVVADISIIGGLSIPAAGFISNRRVWLKIGMDFSYEVIPTGGYTPTPDGSKQYTAFPAVYEAFIYVTPRIEREEPDWQPKEVPISIEPYLEKIHPLR